MGWMVVVDCECTELPSEYSRAVGSVWQCDECGQFYLIDEAGRRRPGYVSKAQVRDRVWKKVDHNDFYKDFYNDF